MDDPNDQQEAPSNIVIGEQEYAPDEAQSLIELGRKTKENQEKWNVNLDTVWPEYGKSREAIKSMEQQLAEANAQLEQFQSKKDAGVETQRDIQEAREAARRLDLIFKDDLEKSYVKREDLEKYISEREQKNQAVQAILKRADELESSISGADGRPRFNKKIVLAYANAYGYDDLEKAYEDMHKDTLDEWKKQQVELNKKPSLKTLKPGEQKKEPKKVQVTGDNVNELLRETLWGAE